MQFQQDSNILFPPFFKTHDKYKHHNLVVGLKASNYSFGFLIPSYANLESSQTMAWCIGEILFQNCECSSHDNVYQSNQTESEILRFREKTKQNISKLCGKHNYCGICKSMNSLKKWFSSFRCEIRDAPLALLISWYALCKSTFIWTVKFCSIVLGNLQLHIFKIFTDLNSYLKMFKQTDCKTFQHFKL